MSFPLSCHFFRVLSSPENLFSSLVTGDCGAPIRLILSSLHYPNDGYDTCTRMASFIHFGSEANASYVSMDFARVICKLLGSLQLVFLRCVSLDGAWMRLVSSFLFFLLPSRPFLRLLIEFDCSIRWNWASLHCVLNILICSFFPPFRFSNIPLEDRSLWEFRRHVQYACWPTHGIIR